MTDHLARLNEREVAQFYRRFALDIRLRCGADSLASALLLHWLDGGGRTRTLPAHELRNLSEIRAHLRTTARAILLSLKPLPGSGAVDGIVPRLRGTIKCTPPGGPYALEIAVTVDTDLSARLKAAPDVTIAAAELGSLYAFDGWTVTSDVVMSATPTATAQQYDVTFESWRSTLRAGYVWDPARHMTVPNPDFGSSNGHAVAPSAPEITLYGVNAARVENAGMANPFVYETDPWDETDLAVVGPATVSV